MAVQYISWQKVLPSIKALCERNSVSCVHNVSLLQKKRVSRSCSKFGTPHVAHESTNLLIIDIQKQS